METQREKEKLTFQKIREFWGIKDDNVKNRKKVNPPSFQFVPGSDRVGTYAQAAALKRNFIELRKRSKPLIQGVRIDSDVYVMEQIDKIAKQILDHLGFTIEEIRGMKRTEDLSLARQTIMTFIKLSIANATLGQIGKFFFRDHTTVIHAVSTTADRYSVDPVFKNNVDRLCKIIDEDLTEGFKRLAEKRKERMSKKK